MLLTALIGIGLKSVSQNSLVITKHQLKQIRLLENQARTDSLKVIELNKAIDTLNAIIVIKNIRINNSDKIINLQDEKINLQDTLIGIRNDKLKVCKIEKKEIKKQVRNRTLIIIGSAILNSIFIIKTIQ